MIEINVAVVVAVVADSLQPGSSAARPDGSGTEWAAFTLGSVGFHWRGDRNRKIEECEK